MFGQVADDDAGIVLLFVGEAAFSELFEEVFLKGERGDDGVVEVVSGFVGCLVE